MPVTRQRNCFSDPIFVKWKKKVCFTNKMHCSTIAVTTCIQTEIIHQIENKVPENSFLSKNKNLAVET